MHNKSTLVLAILLVVISSVASRYKDGAQYWEGRATREMALKEGAIHRLRLCSGDLSHLQTEVEDIRTNLTTLRTQTNSLSRECNHLARQQTRFERAVRDHCPAAMDQIISESTPTTP